jgi:CDP-glucose 4,6-dehydratase
MDTAGINRKFWAGKRVFITGHTGFKGSWLSLWLQHLDAEVTGYALAPPTKPSLFELARVSTGMNSVIGDIRDGAALEEAIRIARPEIVFHLAAQPLVRQSYEDPVDTYTTNVIGLIQLLEAVRRVEQIKVVVNVTSDKCYENHAWPWGYRESDTLGGYDPYSSSKACAEIVTSAYRRSFFAACAGAAPQVALASARAGNVIGGGDWANDRLMPDILTGLDKGRAVRLRYPDAVRPWQHVLEPLRGYLAVAERMYTQGGDYAESWNFGPNECEPVSVRQVGERLARLLDKEFLWEPDQAAHRHEAGILKLDCSKAYARLGWYPRMTLQQALHVVAEWHKAYLRGADMREVTLTQIQEYLDVS